MGGGDIDDRSKSRIFAERATSEGRVVLDEALGAHINERSVLSDDEGDLSRLGGEDETGRMAKRITRGAEVDIREEREGLDAAVLVESIVG